MKPEVRENKMMRGERENEMKHTNNINPLIKL